MAHVNITKDLTEVKSKVVFGLTQRQLIFFGTGCAGGCSYLLSDPEKPGQRYCLDSSDCHGSALFLLRPLRKERADTGKDA